MTTCRACGRKGARRFKLVRSTRAPDGEHFCTGKIACGLRVLTAYYPTVVNKRERARQFAESDWTIHPRP